MKAKSRLAVLLTVVFLILNTSVASASDGTLGEARSLLQKGYVDPVPQSVLDAPTIPDMLKDLGDPYTMYFSPEEYKSFLSSLEDTKFAGLGINIDIVSEGVLIINVFPGSPAESAGLKKGDIITKAGGQIMAGVSSENAISILRGPEGSKIQLTVKRQNTLLDFSVTRQVIDIPTVTGGVLDNHIGYIDISTFGSNTSAELGTIINNLRQRNVDSWIVDLRDDPGGYLESVIDLASYFIGQNEVVQVRDREGNITRFGSPDHGAPLKKPVIFLTNSNTASAAEILSAAAKDYRKATLMGTRTYGKGTVQSMFQLSDGSVLKMTIARFYSPLGNSNNKVGVSPDIAIEKTDSERAAELLLGDLYSNTSPAQIVDKSGLLLIDTMANNFPISLDQARTPEYWASFQEILSSVAYPAVRLGTSRGWAQVSETELNLRFPLLYPGYDYLGDLKDIPLNKKFTVGFQGNPDWTSVNAQDMEIINSKTGERVALAYQPLDANRIELIPQKNLEPDTEYWLVIHTGLKDENGNKLKNGEIGVFNTAGITKASTIEKAKVMQFGRHSIPNNNGQDFLDIAN